MSDSVDCTLLPKTHRRDALGGIPTSEPPPPPWVEGQTFWILQRETWKGDRRTGNIQSTGGHRMPRSRAMKDTTTTAHASSSGKRHKGQSKRLNEGLSVHEVVDTTVIGTRGIHNDTLRRPNPGKGNLQLAMREDLCREVHTNLLQSKALGLVDGHGVRHANRELRSFQREPQDRGVRRR